MAIDALLSRRTVRQYTGDPIPKDQLKSIEKAVLHSPTARNQQGCSYVFVTNKAKLDQITAACLNAFEPAQREYFETRPEGEGTRNKITGDAPLVVFVHTNERASPPFDKVDAGVAVCSVCVAASEFGLSTMIIGAYKAAEGEWERIIDIPPKSFVIAVAVGKAIADPVLREKGPSLAKVTFIE
uniref:Nitroreductase family protein n=1 Tax=Coptotermes formosanus TaxID=36987 RepID=R4UMT9_COPFO|nr:nitroreductase family protein [Coptotermes formosanus]